MTMNAMKTTPEKCRQALGLALPELAAAIGTYLPGQRVGSTVTTPFQWLKAASISALNGFAQSRQAAGAPPTMFEPTGTVPVAILEPQHP